MIKKIKQQISMKDLTRRHSEVGYNFSANYCEGIPPTLRFGFHPLLQNKIPAPGIFLVPSH